MNLIPITVKQAINEIVISVHTEVKIDDAKQKFIEILNNYMLLSNNSHNFNYVKIVVSNLTNINDIVEPIFDVIVKFINGIVLKEITLENVAEALQGLDDFHIKLSSFLDLYQINYIGKKIDNKISILRLFEMYEFYYKIIYPNDCFNSATWHPEHINADAIICFVNGIRVFDYASDKIGYEKKHYAAIVKIMHVPDVIIELCKRIHTLINEKNIDKFKIMRIVTLINSYSKQLKSLFFITYLKYFKMRVMDHKYNRIGFEREILKMLNGFLTFKQVAYLNKMLVDVENSAELAANIQNNTAIKSKDINLKVINPLVVNQHLWSFEDFIGTVIYPDLINRYIEICKIRHGGKLNILPNVSIVVFDYVKSTEDVYGRKNTVEVTCNLLQYIILSELITKPMTAEELSSLTNIYVDVIRMILNDLICHSIVSHQNETYFVSTITPEKINCLKKN